VRSPTTPGLYWLALDEGGAFTTPSPLLVRLSIVEPYGEARIEFLDFPGRDPEKTFTPLLDEPVGSGKRTEGIKAFANGSMHRFRDQDVKLRWVAPVRPPKLPRIKP